jgi:hypothetical protein
MVHPIRTSEGEVSMSAARGRILVGVPRRRGARTGSRDHHGASAARLLVATLLVFLVVLTAGCKIEMALDTIVELDGSGSVGVRLAADKEILDLMGSQGGSIDLFDQFEEGVPEGWEADSGTDADGTKWVTARRLFDDPSELDSLFQMGSGGPAESMGVSEFSLTQEKSLFSVTTDFKAAWDMESLMSSSGEELPAGVDLGAVSSIFEVQNRLTLPGSIKDNNADEVDGSTLIWRPTLAGTAELYATSVAYRWPLILGIFGGVSLVVLVLLVVIVLLLLRSRKNPAPAGPGPGTPQTVPPPPPSPQQPTTSTVDAAATPAPGPPVAEPAAAATAAAATQAAPEAVTDTPETEPATQPAEEGTTGQSTVSTAPVFASRPAPAVERAPAVAPEPAVDTDTAPVDGAPTEQGSGGPESTS